METITGYVEHIIYSSDRDYKVVSFSTAEEDIIVVGTLPGVDEGVTLIVRGEYVEHATYGRQFKVASYEVTKPTDIAGIEHYLSSGSIKGVGKALAKRIVSRFGENSIRIIEEEPEKLAEIKGISLKKAMNIADQIIEEKELRDVMIYLDRFGIGSANAPKIYDKYGTKVYKIIQENPYRLADDVEGIGFKTADNIALRMNIAVDSDYRISAAIMYALSKGIGEGHTFVMADNLRQVVCRLINVNIDSINVYLMNLAAEKRIVIKEERVYLTAYYYMEMQCASMLLGIDDTFTIEEDRLNEAVSRIEDKQKIKLDALQRDAVKTAVTHGVCVLTGGPGTGKTTTIKTILEFFELENMNICLAAPTGRAAKRMTEATYRGAKTIHRLLEVKGAVDTDTMTPVFEKNKDNRLDCDVVIIDEMSMVDITLFYHLLSAIAVGTRLIMVGDINQLPSVGAGNVLKDIISTGRFASVTLDRVFRQSNESDIIVNAYKINKGQAVDINKKSNDFFFVKRQDASSVISLILSFIKDKLPNYVNTNPYNVQILTPSKKTNLGTIELNRILQEKLNPAELGKEEYLFGEKIFRVGDKVMQTKNNYQLEWKIYSKYDIVVESGSGVFNGDMGVVTMVDKLTGILRVLFDDEKCVDYPFAGLGELEHAYAITVHKSQGSEYPAVVIPLLKTPEQLMTRNILYTAITRARQCVVIIGSEEVFRQMISNTMIAKRNSSLDLCIEELERKN